MTPGEAPAVRPLARTQAAPLPSKIHPAHLQRKALVYVRQSDPRQVVDHPESTARQYAFVERACALGWHPDLVSVIDDDLGISASTAEGRTGFHLLLAEVALDRVGLVLGVEMSRLARCNKDWHHLLELCAVFHTLLADADGLYGPRDYNDRLLLGFKGAMSEAELHILRSRLLEGQRHKARRGRLSFFPPSGYVRDGTGEGVFVLDPDEQVQATIRLVFDQFDRQGSAHALLRYLVRNKVEIPVRPHRGPQRDQLVWRAPHRVMLLNLLHHPLYAGYYCWGRKPTDPRRRKPGVRGSGRVRLKPEDWPVLLEDHCPAYISKERFWANQRRLADNQARVNVPGPVREGSSLLEGLVVCGTCQRRLRVSYSHRGRWLRYVCAGGQNTYGTQRCQAFQGQPLEELVTDLLLEALAPASLELSLAAADDIETQRRQLEQQWRLRLERAEQEADRAARQYQRVEPENRLVARTLESAWEKALRDLESLREEFASFQREVPSRLSAAEREQVRALAEDVPRLWQAATTTQAERQRIARFLIEQVVVTPGVEREELAVVVRWAGGEQTHHTLARRVGSYSHLARYKELMLLVEELHRQGQTWGQIAARLDAEGPRPPKGREAFTAGMVGRLLSRQKCRSRKEEIQALLGADEWLLSDLARELDMPVVTVQKWRKQGWLVARKLAHCGGVWVVSADKEELERLHRLRRQAQEGASRPFPADLTTPGRRPGTET